MKKIIGIMIIGVFFFAFNSCKKKAEGPPVSNYLGARYYGVPELKALATCTNSCQKEFTSDVYFAGVVVADQQSGNFYKEVYVRDRYNTGAIHLDLLSGSCNFFIGDSVRFNLKGYDIGLNSKSGLLEIDSIDCEKAMVKFASGPPPQPKIVDLSLGNFSNYYCDLIAINSVGFLPVDTNKIWADAVNQLSINRTIQDCNGNQLIVRTSNYAGFWNQKTPKGWGTIIGIAQVYGSTNQMSIRTPSELSMTGIGCILYHKKDWNDNNLGSGGWIQQSVQDPAVLWGVSTFSGKTFAKITGYYSATNHNAENWLISPAINLSASTNPVLSFVTAANFSGTPLEVWASTTYTSGLPNTLNWTQLTGFTLPPPSGYVFTQSGTISLSAFKNSNTRIAFRYRSTTSGSTTYELDDVVIKEN